MNTLRFTDEFTTVEDNTPGDIFEFLSGSVIPPTEILQNLHGRATNSSNITHLNIHISGPHENETLFRHYPAELLDFGATCCIVFAITGAIGNLITILALSKCPRLRNATTAFIINLCVADLLFCCFSLPLSAVTFLERDWNYGETLCKLFPLFRYSNAAVSIFSVIAITLNRYVLVVHPKVYPSIYKPCNIGLMVAAMWLCALLLLSPPLFEVWGRFGYDPKVGTCSILPSAGRSPKVFLYTAAFGFSSVVFIVCYSRIFWVVRRASKKAQKKSSVPKRSSIRLTFTSKSKWLSKSHRHSEMTSATSSNNGTPKRDKTELRVLRIMMVIFLTFVLCYFPVSFVKIFRREDDLPVLNIMGYLGVYFSNCINPVIYAAMSLEYRRAFVQLFTPKKTWTSSTV